MDVSKNRRGTIQETIAVGLFLIVCVASVLMFLDKKSSEREGPSLAQAFEESNKAGTTLAIKPSSTDLSGEDEEKPSRFGTNEPANVSTEKSGISNTSYESVSNEAYTISVIPSTKQELEAIYSQSRGLPAKILPAGNPLELNSFMPLPVKGGFAGQLGVTSIPAVRRNAISMGLAVSQKDQRELPKLSGSTIVGYLQDHFISVQVQVAKDPVTQDLFLLPSPVAGTAKFQGARVTQHSEPAVLSSIKNFRCLGLFLRPEVKATPETLRTLAFVYRYRTAGGTHRNSEPKTQYDLLFVRAKFQDGKFNLHTFITEKDQSVLHYVGAADTPRSVRECSIQADVFFDEYSHGSLIPTDAIVRNSKLLSRRSYDVSHLEEHAHSQQWEGGLWANMTKILDAIIESQ